MIKRVIRRNLNPNFTGGAGRPDESVYGVELSDNEEIVAITEHHHYPTVGCGGNPSPIISYNAWIVRRDNVESTTERR